MAAKKTGQTCERVPVRLFKDGNRYKDDVFVAVNGRAVQIRRGVTVLVDPAVAEVLENSLDQDDRTASRIQQEAGRYETQARQLGV